METTVVDNNDGSYAVSYTPEEPGVYSVWVCVRAQHVKVRFSLCERWKWMSESNSWQPGLVLDKWTKGKITCTSPVSPLLQGSPFILNVQKKFRRHGGKFHCCSFCSSGGAKEARCGCPGTMPGAFFYLGVTTAENKVLPLLELLLKLFSFSDRMHRNIQQHTKLFSSCSGPCD